MAGEIYRLHFSLTGGGRVGGSGGWKARRRPGRECADIGNEWVAPSVSGKWAQVVKKDGWRERDDRCVEERWWVGKCAWVGRDCG